MMHVLDYFELKPQFELPGYPDAAIYVEPDTLSLYANPDHWQYVARTLHPNRLQAEQVRHDGFALRRSASRKLNWYDREPSH
jgi:hypothetical protein